MLHRFKASTLFGLLWLLTCAPSFGQALEKVGPSRLNLTHIIPSASDAQRVLGFREEPQVRTTFLSTDGGASFEEINTGVSELLSGHVCGADGRFYALGDQGVWCSPNGSSWAKTPLPPSTYGDLKDLAASTVTAREVWVVTSTSAWRSTNGGASFSATALSLPGLTGAGIALDSGQAGGAVVCGADAVARWTVDGGASWTASSAPVDNVNGNTSRGKYDLCLNSGVTLVTESFVNKAQNRIIHRTDDAGQSWLAAFGPACIGAFDFDPEVPGRVVLAPFDVTASVLESTDSGLRWAPLSGMPRSPLRFEDLGFQGGGEDGLYFVAELSAVLRQAESGGPLTLSASMSSSIDGVSKLALDPADRDHMVVLGLSVNETWDGGETWEMTDLPPSLGAAGPLALRGNGDLFVGGRTNDFPHRPFLWVRESGAWRELVLPSATVDARVSAVAVTEVAPYGLAVGVSPTPITGAFSEPALLHYSSNGGAGWTTTSAMLLPGIQKLVILEGTDGPRIIRYHGYVSSGAWREDLFWSDDINGTWTRIPRRGRESPVAWSRRTPRRGAVGSPIGLETLESMDGFTNWSFPNAPVQSDLLAIGSVDPELRVRASFESGDPEANVYVSRNGGASWALAGTMPPANLRDQSHVLRIRRDDSEAFISNPWGLYRVPLDGIVGSAVCNPSVANSRGLSAGVTAHGSTSIAEADLRLHAARLPRNTTCMWIGSQTVAITPNPAGSEGILCLGGAIGRYTSSIGSTFALGEMDLMIDPAALATPAGTQPAGPGETWTFQVWYRDIVGGSATSNFSDAVSVQWL